MNVRKRYDHFLLSSLLLLLFFNFVNSAEIQCVQDAASVTWWDSEDGNPW